MYYFCSNFSKITNNSQFNQVSVVAGFPHYGIWYMWIFFEIKWLLVMSVLDVTLLRFHVSNFCLLNSFSFLFQGCNLLVDILFFIDIFHKHKQRYLWCYLKSTFNYCFLNPYSEYEWRKNSTSFAKLIFYFE